MVCLFCLLVACGGSGSIETRAGGVGDQETTTVTPAVTTTAAQAVTATTVRVATTPGPPQTPVSGALTTPSTRRVDDYLPAGVPDQIFPPGTSAYQLLKEGQCGPLLRQITKAEAPTTATWSAGGVPAVLTDLYTAAANACLAQWTPAQAAFARVLLTKICPLDPDDPKMLLNPFSSSFSTVAACQAERLRVYRWTESLLKSHTDNPAFVPNFPTRPKA